jgi:hypothetical protein
VFFVEDETVKDCYHRYIKVALDAKRPEKGVFNPE